MGETYWNSADTASGLAVLVNLNESLLLAASAYWAEINKKSTEDELSAFEQLKNFYQLNSKNVFLLIAPPMKSIGGWNDYYAFQILSNASSPVINYYGFGQEKLAKIDSCREKPISSGDEFYVCLFSFPKQKNEVPHFVIEVDIMHGIKPNGASKATENLNWIGYHNAINNYIMYFRVENTKVNIINMVQNGISWSAISSEYLKSHSNSQSKIVSSEFNDFVYTVVLDLGKNLLLAAITKGVAGLTK